MTTTAAQPTAAGLVQHDLGNNEGVVTGIAKTEWGFTALTRCASKTFKTESGAARWLAAPGVRR
jgi:hypothetical protein